MKIEISVRQEPPEPLSPLHLLFLLCGLFSLLLLLDSVAALDYPFFATALLGGVWSVLLWAAARKGWGLPALALSLLLWGGVCVLLRDSVRVQLQDALRLYGSADAGSVPFTRTALLAAGYTDTFRLLHPDAAEQYSWWSYRFQARQRNAGWRIDYWLISERLLPHLQSAQIGRAHV